MKNVKNNKSGFSLVELIVVLVIMAILVAALVPSLIGYINQARQSTAKDEASSIVQAAQTIVSSAYADPDSTYWDQSGSAQDVDFSAMTEKDWSGDILSLIDSGSFCTTLAYLSEIDFTYDGESYGSESEDGGTLTSLTIDAGVVTAMEYTASNGEGVSYSNGTYTDADE